MRYLLIAVIWSGFFGLLALAGQQGWITANPSGSVPVGVYVKAAPERADYVSFCLTKKHQLFKFYDRFCSPDNPDGKRILKRIAERRANGSLVVEGDTDLAIDSKILGSIDPDQTRGFWNALLVLSSAEKEHARHA